MTVTLDDAANDGRPGEGDNVVGIEQLDMYITGDDVLVGYDFDDQVDGGAGNDTVEGGRGHDTVTGGPGRDTIYGDATSSHCSWYSCKVPFGDDTIQARDGEVDNIDCGIGTDTAVVDTIDVVANCENVDAANAPAKLTFKVKRTSLRALARKGLTARVPCPSACKVSGALLLGGMTANGQTGSKKVTLRR